jgi:hypothetical protein
MGGNGREWEGMGGNGREWERMGQNGREWERMDRKQGGVRKKKEEVGR